MNGGCCLADQLSHPPHSYQLVVCSSILLPRSSFSAHPILIRLQKRTALCLHNGVYWSVTFPVFTFASRPYPAELFDCLALCWAASKSLYTKSQLSSSQPKAASRTPAGVVLISSCCARERVLSSGWSSETQECLASGFKMLLLHQLFVSVTFDLLSFARMSNAHAYLLICTLLIS